MANLSELNLIIVDLFGVLGTVINQVVTLITGDLLVLAIVGTFVSMIVGLFVLVFNFIKSHFGKSIKMK